jgi:hypothetical protein
MAHLYEGQPDARQAGTEIKTSRFRPRYRQLTDAEKLHHDLIKETAVSLELLFEGVPQGREVSIAFTKLEEAVMWAVKGLTK